MKKLLFLVMMGALALPMMAQTKAARFTPVPDRASAPELTLSPVQTLNRAAMPVAEKQRGVVLYSWDFEDPAQAEEWSTFDSDGDGYNWGYDNYYGYGHNGPGSMVSASYDGGALAPDNWLISPEVELNGTLSFWARPYSASYPDVFAVYVAVGDGDFVQIGGDYAPTAWTEFTFDLSQYAGAKGCFAIRHYNCYDMWRLIVDDITITAPDATMPTNVAVVPAATTATVTWDAADNVAWNLRYRPASATPNLLWDFEDAAQFAEWNLVDADQDGNNWQYYNNTGLTTGKMTAHDGEGLVSSASYINDDNGGGVAVFPDNWMISPKVSLDGMLSFWAVGQDADYCDEVFGVFVSLDGENWTQIGEDVTVTDTYVQYFYNLREFRGQEGYVAIRHYNVTDQFMLNVDDIMIDYASEWITIEGLSDPNYVIDGLTPETDYEVQVQGMNADGGMSAWTASVPFTTLEGGEVPPVVDQVGSPRFEGYTEDGITGYGVTIIPTTEGSSIMYRVYVEEEGQWVLVRDWTLYEGTEMEIWYTEENAKYRVEAYAFIGDVQSQQVAYEFVVEYVPQVGIDEINGGKTVAGVRYFNVAGQEMPEANGMTIVVTTYTDGTTSATKVVK